MRSGKCIHVQELRTLHLQMKNPFKELYEFNRVIQSHFKDIHFHLLLLKNHQTLSLKICSFQRKQDFVESSLFTWYWSQFFVSSLPYSSLSWNTQVDSKTHGLQLIVETCCQMQIQIGTWSRSILLSSIIILRSRMSGLMKWAHSTCNAFVMNWSNKKGNLMQRKQLIITFSNNKNTLQSFVLNTFMILHG